MTTRRNPTGTRTGNHRGHRTAQEDSGPTTGAGALIDALSSRNDLLLDSARRAADRSHRLFEAAIDDIQSAQRDAARLLQRWAEAPFDLVGLYSGIVDAAIGARVRIAQAVALWQHELSEARTEVGETLRRSMPGAATPATAGPTRYEFVRRNGHS